MEEAGVPEETQAEGEYTKSTDRPQPVVLSVVVWIQDIVAERQQNIR